MLEGVTLPLHDPVAIFCVVLLVLLVAPLVARLQVPTPVTLLLAGVVLGPHATGVLARDVTIVLLGTVGLLYIMFLAGLEIDLFEFKRQRQRSVVFGLATFAIPQAGGTAVGVALGLPWAGAILLGSVLASHTLLAYPVAQKLGLQKTVVVTTAVGATILTDTLALLVLAVVAAGAQPGGDGMAAGLQIVAMLAGLSLLVLWGLPRLGAWVFRSLTTDATAEFVFVLASVFTCALLTEWIGVEAIIGAFLAGLALNRLVPESSTLMNRIGFFGNALFIPFFLLSTGMLVDVSAFTESVQAWQVAGAMTLTVVAAKGLAAWSTRVAFKFSAVEARMLFGLTLPQAAATLAAVLVGHEIGLFDEAILNGTIAMVAVTCFVGPWVVERAGARLQAKHMPETSSMQRARVLVPVANPHTVQAVMEVALTLRTGEHDALYVTTVVPGGADQASHVLQGERLLAGAVMHAAAASVTAVPLVRVAHNIARALTQVANEHRISTLVMGWDGSPAAERVLLGTIPDRVLRDTPATVLIAKPSPRPLGTLGRLVVAVPPLAELEPGFRDVIQMLGTMARRLSVPLVFVTSAAYQAALRQAVRRVHLSVPVQEEALDAWRHLVAHLDTSLRPSDGLVLLAARQGSLAWRASLERLPRVLGRRFHDRFVLIAYPSQVPASTLLPAGLTTGERAVLDWIRSEHITVDLAPGSVEGIYRQLAAKHPKGRKGVEWLVAALAQADPDASPELRPGVVLNHCRSAAVEVPTVLVGVQREGIVMPHASGPVYVVLVLLAPEHVPSSHYLGWLAVLSRLVRDDETLEQLRAAQDADAVRHTLLRALQAREASSTADPEALS